MPLTTFSLRPLRHAEVKQAAALCAAAMLDNPLHIQVFGRAERKRQRRLWQLFMGLLPYIERNGELMGAYADGQLIGVLGRLRPNCCQPSWQDRFKLIPTLLSSNSPLGVLKTLRWLSSWAKLDPAKPHWHLGPLAVSPQYQRQGIGRALMQYAINEADGHSLYLETDKLSNVQFYQSLGFRITAQPILLSTPTWLMLKLPAEAVRCKP